MTKYSDNRAVLIMMKWIQTVSFTHISRLIFLDNRLVLLEAKDDEADYPWEDVMMKRDLYWQFFSNTGNLDAYLLYKKSNEDQDASAAWMIDESEEWDHEEEQESE